MGGLNVCFGGELAAFARVSRVSHGEPEDEGAEVREGVGASWEEEASGNAWDDGLGEEDVRAMRRSQDDPVGATFSLGEDDMERGASSNPPLVIGGVWWGEGGKEDGARWAGGRRRVGAGAAKEVMPKMELAPGLFWA